MAEFEDYYAALGVTPDAEYEGIKGAYKALISKYHPDHGGDVERAKNLTIAYATLSDPHRRADYDRVYVEAKHPPKTRSSKPRPTSRREDLRVEDIPPELIDAILAAFFTEAAAATLRTGGRIVKEVAREVGKQAWQQVREAPARRREAVAAGFREEDRAASASQGRALAKKRAADAAEADRRQAQLICDCLANWSEDIQQRTLDLVWPLYMGPAAKVNLIGTSDEGLLWVAARHESPDARMCAFNELQNRHGPLAVVASCDGCGNEVPIGYRGTCSRHHARSSLRSARLATSKETDGYRRTAKWRVAAGIVVLILLVALLAMGVAVFDNGHRSASVWVHCLIHVDTG